MKKTIIIAISLFLFWPINIIQAKEANTNFAYNQPRLPSLTQEKNKAIELKTELEKVFKKGKIPISARNWNTVVNSYIYGSYPVDAITAAIFYGGKTVHPTISWTAWQKTQDYQNYLDKYLTRGQFQIIDNNHPDSELIEFEDLTALSAITVDINSGEVLFKKNIDQVLPIASLTKLMTALVFLENNPGWDKIVTYEESDDDVLNYAEKREMAYLKIEIGEQLTVEDLFYTGLVGSANNSIYALARSTGLTREEFVELMNEKAKKWNLKNTNFIEPSGLSPENVSTAKDFSKIAYYALADDNIRLATSYRYWEFRTINTKKYHKVKTVNNLLKRNLNFKIRGTKTGYLEEADRCLVAKGELGGKSVIAIVLGSHGWGYFDEVERLVEFGLGINDIN